LEKRKIIIGYKTKINYEKLGFLHFRVFLQLNRFDLELYKKIKNFLRLEGSVESVSRYMGYSDVEFRCYAKSIIELHNKLTSLKDNFLNNIIDVESINVFNWEKINYYR
jgi:DNA-binding Lrp family transcriptional regulator